MDAFENGLSQQICNFSLFSKIYYNIMCAQMAFKNAYFVVIFTLPRSGNILNRLKSQNPNNSSISLLRRPQIYGFDSATHFYLFILWRNLCISRATTDFTGWPTPPTTPLSAEKILEMASRTTTTTTTTTTTEATTTTTSTTTTPRPTTPGICTSECQLAGTIRLTDGAQWVPELIDRNTAEYKSLAANITAEVSHTVHKALSALRARVT
jgi:hypothetical protein